jgi:uncharacterized protein (DUF2062 family)
MLRALIQRRLFEPILQLLRQGITPEKIALSLALGFGLGIFPVLGVSTILCTVIALALRLNLPAIQLANYAASPVQILLIIPFVRVGEHLLRAAPEPLSIRSGLRLLGHGVFEAVIVLWSAIVHAALGWALLGPPFIYLVYLLLKLILIKAARSRQLMRTGAQPAP